MFDRRLRNAALLLAVGAAQPLVGCAQPADAPEREITNVTGDLYRFREIRHIGMFLVTGEGIIVVDPTNPGLAAWLKEELDQRFGLPVRYVIYSHSHNDHASGGEVFADTATFIGHVNMRKNLQKPPPDAPLLPRERLWDVDGNGTIESSEANPYASQAFELLGKADTDGLTRSDIWEVRFGGGTHPPDIYYADHLTVRLGGKSVELHYTGRNHTDDMTTVLFPEERTIYTVDFLTPNRLPFTDLDGGYLPEWLASLRLVEQLDFDIVSPGHEAVGTKAQVSEQVRYMEDLIAEVSAGIAAGRSKQELVDTVLLEQYSHLLEYDNFRPQNVGGAYEILVSSGQ
jgi:glyoxylase-like metal-dependent hydrolase (beta-lactamase superfamily II)